MREIQLEIFLNTGGMPLVLPIHYNHLVQAAIYNSIDEDLAAFLHDKGYVSGQRSFKMFTFSRLTGAYKINSNDKTISFSGEIKLIISSPLKVFCQSLVNILLTRGSIRLGTSEIEVAKVFASGQAVEKEELKTRTLSPVVLYSTMLRPEGGKYTVYFQPGDPDYNRLLTQNLCKKYMAYYAKEPPEGEVQAKPLGPQKLNIVEYKGIIIKGYSGRLMLQGPIPLLQLAVDCGIGGKNSQGFGCLEVLKQ